MPTGYQIKKQDAAYFVTWTVIGWADVFIKGTYRNILIDALNYSTENKGLQIFAYVIMSNHVHLIVRAQNHDLSSIIGSIKRFTCNQIIQAIKTGPESRREWLLPLFRGAGEKNKRNEKYQFWIQGNHAEEVYSLKFTLCKMNYIHNNPVKAGLVLQPHDFLYSSARDYAGMPSPVKIVALGAD